MPFLKSRFSYIDLEDISAFEFREFVENDFDGSERVVLHIWTVGDSKPFVFPLDLLHKAVDVFANSLVELIESARNGGCRRRVYEIDELVARANAAVKEKQVREVTA
jgi:hypothetical protein